MAIQSAKAVIDMAELGVRLAGRRATLSQVTAPRNAGTRRTASKKALLAAIEKTGGKW